MRTGTHGSREMEFGGKSMFHAGFDSAGKKVIEHRLRRFPPHLHKSGREGRTLSPAELLSYTEEATSTTPLREYRVNTARDLPESARRADTANGDLGAVFECEGLQVIHRDTSPASSGSERDAYTHFDSRSPTARQWRIVADPQREARSSQCHTSSPSRPRR